jgi:hypothetical protein
MFREFREFQKVQANRRKVQLRTKPHIRKLRGVDTWVCRHMDARLQTPGFGLSPADAYWDWKRRL